MMLFWAQVTRCTAFIINKRLAKIYFWCVLGTFEFVYLTCFLLVFANKVHVVLDNDPFDYYLSGHVGYEVLTLMQGLVDSLKCFNGNCIRIENKKKPPQF